MKIQNRFELAGMRQIARKQVTRDICRILVCAGTGCIAGGSLAIYENFRQLAA